MSTHKIKILAPIDRVEEALSLIKAGTDEFFCGVIVDGKNLSIRRDLSAEASNLPSLETLRRLVNIVKIDEKKIFVAMNRPCLGFKEAKIIEYTLKKMKGIGIDGIIVGSIDLMKIVKNCGLEIIASSFLEAKNEETVKLLVKEFGVKRIILDRQITLDDIKNIVPKFPKTEFETFILETGCRSLATACQWHLVNKKKYLHIHLCASKFSIDSKNDRAPLSLEDRKIITGRLKMPFKCCGACALFQFQRYNITSVKIVGRCHSTERKIRNIKFIRNVLNLLEQNYSQEEFYKRVEKLFEKIFHKKCNKQYCYYPHFFNKDK